MKENKIIKKIISSPLMIMVLVIVVAVISSLGTSYAANTYLYDSKDVSYDNTRSGITATNVQGAVDELYACATDFVSYNTRVKSEIYPVGSVYISVNNTNPGILFGGTWEKQDDNYYLRTASSGGDYSAATNVGATTLTAAQSGVPAHTHSVSVSGGNHTHEIKDGYGTYLVPNNGTWSAGSSGYGRSSAEGTRVKAAASGNLSMSGTASNNTAKDAAESHTHSMGTPATITVVMWVRTA